ncbi:spermatogenesis-associated protein 20 isoform X2 [Selaginella moellendorffii]|nr:spermatogenesis-associated protein 20 isoform X2 [Selaginella moellendorffii]|eukprot:XP_002994074.2 spermatogenesis-associated protein 20 isoform X2 [Selaginella moellendorffii]
MFRLRHLPLAAAAASFFRPAAPARSSLQAKKRKPPAFAFARTVARAAGPDAMADKHSASSATAAGSGDKHKHSNRLLHENSPYLLQHAHNPVDWYPWGEEAFAKAKAEDKPIFLSVGYSTCHWCHVMEVESFESEEVAKLLNDWFVSIKVDREERPDVDKIYMTFVQASQGGGGWPMSVFLTPELKPIVGGTYFPPEDNYGRPGFKTVLRRVKENWDSRKAVLRNAGDNVIQQLAEAMAACATSLQVSGGVAEQAVQLCASQLMKGFDAKLGGFGSAPKFPRPVELNLMLRYYKRLDQAGKASLSKKALEMASFNLQCMARGGMHDHVGGGFHRYSVDDYWHVPHFEKMLYDQAQLANAYLDVYLVTRDTMHACVARDILDYLNRDMTHPEGGIFSAEDADSLEPSGSSKKKEGAFYVWTAKEIEDVLGKDRAQIFAAHYYVREQGNCNLSRMSDPHNEFLGKNVLIERQSLADTVAKFGKTVEETADLLGQCRELLHAHRSKRPRPHLDDKVIVAWNGLAISAYSRASRFLRAEPEGLKHYFPDMGCDPKDYLIVAERIAKFVKDKIYNASAKRLQRSYRKSPSQAPGFLDDYAFLIAGLLDLYEASGDTKWLAWVFELQEVQDHLFLDKEGGGYFSTAEGDSSILFRMKEDYDGAEPSGNSVAAINLLRLASICHGEEGKLFLERAQHLLAVFEGKVKELAMAVPLMCCAYDVLAVPSKRQILVAGAKTSGEFDALVTTSHLFFDPDSTIIQIDPELPSDVEFWQAKNPMLLAMAQGKAPKSKAVAFVCQDFKCYAPVSDAAALERLLNKNKSKVAAV